MEQPVSAFIRGRTKKKDDLRALNDVLAIYTAENIAEKQQNREQSKYCLSSS